VPMELRGLTPSYERTDDRSGVVVLTFCEKVPSSAFTLWEGILQFCYDLTGVKTGEVGTTMVSPDGKTGRIKVKW